ncbi:MAG TPA: hypothetical protein VHU24_09510 [Solirubrobacterales bacterium]|jgi:hypothetical protein|nr:hypothetical protein [Solirubrobacterales bacterium]
MRRALATLITITALGLGAGIAAAAFHVGTYGGYASDGGRVIFTTDTHTAHNFSWEGRHLFDNAQIEHHDGVTRFHTHTLRWQVHGHWVDSNNVEGSICALDSNGGCPSAHLHHYTAGAKTGK